MTTAVDTSVILITDDVLHAAASVEALRREGRIIACECVIAEVRPALATDAELQEMLQALAIEFVPGSQASAVLAGGHFARYLERGGAAGRVLPDDPFHRHVIIAGAPGILCERYARPATPGGFRMADMNRAWTMAAYPHGEPKLSDFALTETPIPTPGPREVLIATHYHSLDPYMRGRMNRPNPAAYAAPVGIGGVMEADAVGEVIASNSEGFAVGDFAMGKIGWQEYGVMNERDVRKVDPEAAPISTSVGVLGMPGLTAYFGFFEVGKPVAGDTVVVTAASGAVGAVVGQLGKINGCRVIGVAGSAEKVAYVEHELGFDACINYKTDDVPARLDELCPNGIDVYWDNVGGPVTDAAIDRIALFGRAVICGQIAFYNATSPPQGPRNIPRMLLTRRARMEGFLVFQFQDRYQEGLARLAAWINDGSLQYREDVVEGIEHSPEAFIGLLRGRNYGKLVVRVR